MMKTVKTQDVSVEPQGIQLHVISRAMVARAERKLVSRHEMTMTHDCDPSHLLSSPGELSSSFNRSSITEDL